MTKAYRNSSLDEMRTLVSESASYAEVARKLGRQSVGGTIASISLYCKRNEIDTSHMTGRAHKRGKVPNHKRPPESIFVLGTKLDYRTKPALLRRALLEIGVPHVCNVCGISEWLGKLLLLEIDHIDGQYWNNVRDNLQFICPNCHSMK